MKRLITAAAALALAAAAQSATVTHFTDLAAWQAAAGSTTTQDFSSMAVGSSVLNTTVLPGVTVTTNLERLVVWDSSTHEIFALDNSATTRLKGTAEYELEFSLGYKAAAFDIGAFESALPPYNIGGGAVTAGTVEIDFADGDVQSFAVTGGNGANIFFGVAGNTAITRIRWFEALEPGNVNEETTLDNLRVGPLTPTRTDPTPPTTVPEPASLLLVAGALGLVARRRR